MSCSDTDTGLLKIVEPTFVWRRSKDGWTDVVEKLSAMRRGSGYQYLDGPRDDVQGIVSIGE